jgi:hypothetical protein
MKTILKDILLNNDAVFTMDMIWDEEKEMFGCDPQLGCETELSPAVFNQCVAEVHSIIEDKFNDYEDLAEDRLHTFTVQKCSCCDAITFSHTQKFDI